VSKLYEQILDLENKARVSAERSPPLSIAWPPQALQEQQLYTVSMVFAHLLRIDEKKRTAYGRYLQSLGMLAKNDIFGQFEQAITIGLYEAPRTAMTSYGDWDGNAATFEAAAEKCITNFPVEGETNAHLQETLRFCDALANEKNVNSQVSLNDVAKIKVYCDIYFIKKANEWMTEERKKEKEKNSGIG
jgi:hypothetical protein